MPTTTNELPLRHVDRRRLLKLLDGLGDPDPARRAQSASDATDLLRSKGRTWTSLVPIEYDGHVEPEAEPFDWHDVSDELLGHPNVTDGEKAEIRKFRSWRAPGRAQMQRLEDIGRRVGVLGDE